MSEMTEMTEGKTMDTWMDAQTAVDNSGVVGWEWGGLTWDEVEPRLIEYVFRHATDGGLDNALLRSFIADELGQDPADYSLERG